MLSKGCQDSEVNEKKTSAVKTWGAGARGRDRVFMNQGSWESSGDSGMENFFEEGFRISLQEKAW